MGKKTFQIDNITWNDLGLDDIFSRLNSCITSPGHDRLLFRLKNPYIEADNGFNEYIRLIDEIDKFSKKDENLSLINMLSEISTLSKYKFEDEICSFENEKKESNLKHLVIDLLTVISFALIFVYPGPGIVAFFVMIAIAVSDYFKTKAIISSKLYVFNYLIRMINSVKKYKITGIANYEIFNIKYQRINEIKDVFLPFMFGTKIISQGARVTSNPLSILFDYLRMIFHLDIIKYNSMISFLKGHIKEALELYEIIGDIDTAVAVNKFKERYNVAKPIFDYETGINLVDAYHPLVENPVCNSINTRQGILITGCNASGKSTFLKTVAINVIFAQSFGFVFAKEYKAPFYKIYTSMALKDDITAGESYFVSEIKSLKRILDEVNNDSCKILCVVDEVLRGTNTVERIAASVEILSSLAKDNVLCFLATHDIELTELLSDVFSNYHFTEEIKKDDVVFSYKLYEGAANSRNAIRLLSCLGYDDEIVNNAISRADSFIKNGVWNK